MSTHVPDKWVVLELGTKEHLIKKVFAGWYGGFAKGDSWKLSSSISDVREFKDRWHFHTASGSLYVCFKGQNYGTSSYMNSVYSTWIDETKDTPDIIIQTDEKYA